MGLRYRKSVNLGPLRLNFSKSGIGYSYGVKGYRVTHTADGKVRTTVSVPGTGISHVSEKPAAARPKANKTESGMPLGAKLALLGLVLFFVFIALAGCSADEPDPVPSMSIKEAIAMVEGTREPTEPTTAPTPESDPEPAPKPEPTEPKTEPKTEPPTQPPTQPKTEAPTQPKTEPPTEPEPEPTTEPEPAPVVAYIGNKNSKKLHEVWCNSVDQMKESNKVEFFSRDAAIGLGYDPCKNCDP